jgi:hypothetical protein
MASDEDERHPLTPPEWDEWNLWGKLAYAVTLLAALMALHWLAGWLRSLLG